MTFTEFKTKVEGPRPSYARRGQFAFNELFNDRPDLSERIRGDHAGLDPFHRDENLPAFWSWVEANWGSA